MVSADTKACSIALNRRILSVWHFNFVKFSPVFDRQQWFCRLVRLPASPVSCLSLGSRELCSSFISTKADPFGFLLLEWFDYAGELDPPKWNEFEIGIRIMWVRTVFLEQDVVWCFCMSLGFSSVDVKFSNLPCHPNTFCNLEEQRPQKIRLFGFDSAHNALNCES